MTDGTDLGAYLAEVGEPDLLDRAAAALVAERPTDPARFLSEFFSYGGRGRSSALQLSGNTCTIAEEAPPLHVLELDEEYRRGELEAEWDGASQIILNVLYLMGNPSVHDLDSSLIELHATRQVSIEFDEWRQLDEGKGKSRIVHPLDYDTIANASFPSLPSFPSRRTSEFEPTPFKSISPVSVRRPSGPCSVSLATLANMDHKVALEVSEIESFHSILNRLSAISSLHEAVMHPSARLRWDFGLGRCVPGRVWEDTMPDHVRALLSRDYTPEERKAVEAVCRLHEAPSVPLGKTPRVLYILGPAGAGKSTIRQQVERLLSIDMEGYVEIDGDDMRNMHKGWMDVTMGLSHVGYRDAMGAVSKYIDRCKLEIIEEAIRRRKNLIISQTGQNHLKFLKELERMRGEHGYVIDLIGLVVSMGEAGCRAINRAHECGRWHQPHLDKWDQVMASIKHLMHPQRSDNCIIFDNQDFNNPRTIYTRTHNLTYVSGVIQNYREMDEHVTFSHIRPLKTESK
eukprot:Sspe_Gene.93668::Locus_66230_Transcript_1_1_Confidence_1.000_Length_1697::g.93668::m.93668